VIRWGFPTTPARPAFRKQSSILLLLHPPIYSRCRFFNRQISCRLCTNYIIRKMLVNRKIYKIVIFFISRVSHTSPPSRNPTRDATYEIGAIHFEQFAQGGAKKWSKKRRFLPISAQNVPTFANFCQFLHTFFIFLDKTCAFGSKISA